MDFPSGNLLENLIKRHKADRIRQIAIFNLNTSFLKNQKLMVDRRTDRQDFGFVSQTTEFNFWFGVQIRVLNFGFGNWTRVQNLRLSSPTTVLNFGLVVELQH